MRFFEVSTQGGGMGHSTWAVVSETFAAAVDHVKMEILMKADFRYKNYNHANDADWHRRIVREEKTPVQVTEISQPCGNETVECATNTKVRNLYRVKTTSGELILVRAGNIEKVEMVALAKISGDGIRGIELIKEDILWPENKPSYDDVPFPCTPKQIAKAERLCAKEDAEAEEEGRLAEIEQHAKWEAEAPARALEAELGLKRYEKEQKNKADNRRRQRAHELKKAWKSTYDGKAPTIPEIIKWLKENEDSPGYASKEKFLRDETI